MKVNRIENTATAAGGIDIDSSGNISAGGTVTTGGTINAANTSAAGNAIIIGNSNQIVLEANGSATFAGAVTSTTTAKAWVNFNGIGTVAIRDSHNVASITDNGSGNYTVNFTTAMANANYAILLTSDMAGNNNNAAYERIASTSTSSFSIGIIHSSVLADVNTVCAAVFGD
jgi:hypothetical protein